MHKTSTGARFIVACRKWSTKALSKAVTKAFKLIFKQIQIFHENSHFYSDYKKFWVVENSKRAIDRLDERNTKQNPNLISTFDFSTLYTKLQRKDLLQVLFNLIDFGFNRGSKKKIDFSLKKYLLVEQA